MGAFAELKAGMSKYKLSLCFTHLKFPLTGLALVLPFLPFLINPAYAKSKPCDGTLTITSSSPGSSVTPALSAFLRWTTSTKLINSFIDNEKPTKTTDNAPNTDSFDGECITEITTPGTAGGPYMVLGPDGALWWSAAGSNGPTIGRIETTFPFKVTEFGPLTGGALDMTVGPDGNIWVAEQGSFDCNQSPPSKIGRILTHPPYTITEFPVPGPVSPLFGIATGPDGNLWIARGGNPGGCSSAGPKAFDRMMPYPPYTITEFPVPSFGPTVDALLNRPEKLVAGPDNHLWVDFSPYMVRIDPFGNNKIEVFPIPGATGNFVDINVGPASDPDAIWFMPATANGYSMGRIDTKPPHAITLYPLTLMGQPNSVSPGPDGNMWFTEGRTGYAIGKFDISTHEVTEFPLDDDDYPRAATCGPDGNLWFTETYHPLGNTSVTGNVSVLHDYAGLGTKEGAEFCQSLELRMQNGGRLPNN